MSERVEASLEEWRHLYEEVDALQKRKPWETFWDTDIIAIQDGPLDDARFFSILGAGGDRYGFTMYEGLGNLNDFYLFLSSEKLGIPQDFAVLMQTCLACFITQEQPMPDDRKKVLRQLGIKYRGRKNPCPYFVSFESMYEPQNLDHDQVVRLTNQLALLEQAVAFYEDNHLDIRFENSTIYAYRRGSDGTWAGEADTLPSSVFEIHTPGTVDFCRIRDLREKAEGRRVVQVDAVVMPDWLDVEDYGRPSAFIVGLLVDRDSGLIAGGDVFPPHENFMDYIARHIADFIQRFERPARIEYTNELIGAALRTLCSLCHIELRKVSSMPELDAAALSLRMSFAN